MVRLLVVRHGDRSYDTCDPQLTPLGFKQSKALAQYLVPLGIDIIFSSPMIRSLQTITPTATSLHQHIHVDDELCDLLAHGWLYAEDPTPHLFWNTDRTALPSVPHSLISHSYTAPKPQYPDYIGKSEQGNVAQRAKVIERHRHALQRIFEYSLATVKNPRTILIAAHGGTHDCIADILDPMSHSVTHHAPYCVPHVSVTTFILPRYR